MIELTNKEIEVLLSALDNKIEKECDVNDYTSIINKLEGEKELNNYGR